MFRNIGIFQQESIATGPSLTTSNALFPSVPPALIELPETVAVGLRA